MPTTPARIIAIDESDCGVELTPAMLDHLGVKIGDDLLLTIEDGVIVVRRAEP